MDSFTSQLSLHGVIPSYSLFLPSFTSSAYFSLTSSSAFWVSSALNFYCPPFLESSSHHHASSPLPCPSFSFTSWNGEATLCIHCISIFGAVNTDKDGDKDKWPNSVHIDGNTGICHFIFQWWWAEGRSGLSVRGGLRFVSQCKLPHIHLVVDAHFFFQYGFCRMVVCVSLYECRDIHINITNIG